jgi:hypothetical protein
MSSTNLISAPRLTDVAFASAEDTFLSLSNFRYEEDEND